MENYLQPFNTDDVKLSVSEFLVSGYNVFKKNDLTVVSVTVNPHVHFRSGIQECQHRLSHRCGIK